MIVKNISFSSPQKNILFDQVLLNLAEEGCIGETLRFWESERDFVILGRISKVNDDVNIENVKKDDIPVLRRCSGGGTVLQGKGCLNYSLVLCKDKHRELGSINGSYEYILNKIIQALDGLNISASFMPISDIALTSNQKKISGNAQKRLKKYILHHGTILYNFDIKKVERYLKMPIDVPIYREERAHSNFIANIDVSYEDIIFSIKKVFLADEEVLITEEEKECLNQLIASSDICFD